MSKKVLLKIVILVTVALLVAMSLIFIAFNYVNMNTIVKNLSNMDDKLVAEIQQLHTKEEIINCINGKSNGYVELTVYDDKFEIWADTNSINLLQPNEHVIKNLQNAVNSGSAQGKAVVYNGYDFMQLYTRKIDIPQIENVDYLLVRASTEIIYNNYPFWIVIMIGIGIWLVIVLSLIFSTKKLIKSSMIPVNTLQASLNNISNGEYHKVVLKKYGDPEMDKAFEDIQNIVNNIYNTMRQNKQEHDKSEFLMQAMNQGIIGVSIQNTVLISNDVVNEIFDNNEMIGKPLSMIIEDNNLNTFVDNALEELSYNSMIFKKDRYVFRVETIIAPNDIKDTSLIVMFIIFTDITSEYNSAQARSEFFVNASHELKTPLTAIMGYSELLNINNQNETVAKQCSQEIYDNAKKMKQLIDEMMQLSKIDSQVESESASVFNLEDICKEIAEDQKIIANKSNIEIIEEYFDKGNICSKQNCIRTIIKNILNNAIKYNKDGGKVWITLQNISDKVVLIIADNGIGIEEKYQSRLFERFFKIDSARTRTGESSTGLGLSIVKHLARENKIDIDLYSKIGVGTKFVLVFNN